MEDGDGRWRQVKRINIRIGKSREMEDREKGNRKEMKKGREEGDAVRGRNRERKHHGFSFW